MDIRELYRNIRSLKYFRKDFTVNRELVDEIAWDDKTEQDRFQKELIIVMKMGNIHYLLNLPESTREAHLDIIVSEDIRKAGGWLEYIHMSRDEYKLYKRIYIKLMRNAGNLI